MHFQKQPTNDLRSTIFQTKFQWSAKFKQHIVKQQKNLKKNNSNIKTNVFSHKKKLQLQIVDKS